VRRCRAAVGPDFILVYRMSLLDLVEDGQSWEEVVALAREVEGAGATLISTGIGWHEARIPTIVTSVPRAAFTEVTGRLRQAIGLPVIASNRINTPDTAEAVLARGDADLVSMARPFLADPDWVRKAADGRPDEINTCIGCNQACLDHAFARKVASCLVNPRAAHETELILRPVTSSRHIAVVGAGPAGLAAATTAAERGHAVELFDAAPEIGGQFQLARRIPGKEEFAETLRYYTRRLELTGVKVHLGQVVDAAQLLARGYDEVVLATGVTARVPDIPGVDGPNVHGYADVVLGVVTLGPRVAIIGAGGVGFDVAELLTHAGPAGRAATVVQWRREWGVGDPAQHRGGLAVAEPNPSPRQVFLLQRSTTRVGAGLHKTTGWVHRSTLARRGVEFVNGVNYEHIDETGLTVSLGEQGGGSRHFEVDDIVLCAGQEPRREMFDELRAAGVRAHLIGGADGVAGLDAERAIDQGTRLAAAL
jgi:2,4-dienoyl-CoA reductase (NADPH2)